jgi:hypothetical protein
MMRSTAIGVALLLGIGTGALAQSADEQAACQDDAFRVCGHTIPDRERTFQCMIAYRDSLSPGCRAVMARHLPPEPTSRKASASARQKSRGGPLNLSPPGR